MIIKILNTKNLNNKKKFQFLIFSFNIDQKQKIRL